MAGCADGVALDADVVIVGTGLAGAAAAIACARGGLWVALLERSRRPRERPATLQPHVEAPQRELGRLERALRAGLARHPRIAVMRDGDPRLAASGRASFDALLVQRARELGAAVHERSGARDPAPCDGCVGGAETARGLLRVGAAAPAIVADAGGWTWTAQIADGVYCWTRLALSQSRGGNAAIVLDPAPSHGGLRGLLTGLHAARLARAILAGADEQRLSTSDGAFGTPWLDDDVEALKALYGRLPTPPAWLSAAAAPPAAGRAWRAARNSA